MGDVLGNVQWPLSVKWYFWENFPPSLLSVATVLQEEPAWAAGTGVQPIQFDLHLFYYPGDGLLFEATTSDKVAGKIHEGLEALAGQTARDVPSQEISKLLNLGGDYYTVGLKNVVGRRPTLPEYKTLAGPHAQTTILPSDRRTLTMGHALRWVSQTETRGVNVLRSKAWALRRGTTQGFMDWCDALAAALQAAAIPGGPLQLVVPAEMTTLAEIPLAVQLDYSFMEAAITVTVNGKKTENVVPRIEIPVSGSGKPLPLDEDGTLHCTCYLDPSPHHVDLEYSANAEPFWKQVDTTALKLQLEFPDGQTFEGNLARYLRKFPPSLIMPSGGVAIRNEHWRPLERLDTVPEECLIPLEWGGCDRKDEVGPSHESVLCILDWVAKKSKESTSGDVLVIRDHGAGEIADIIVIEPIGENKRIEFYHCKAMKGNAPGARVEDAYEVLGQACRNGQWLLSPTLMTRLYQCTQPPRSSPLEGDPATLRVLSDQFRYNEWGYKIVAVQPGFDFAKIKREPKVLPLFISTYEWLSACGASFAVWGS